MCVFVCLCLFLFSFSFFPWLLALNRGCARVSLCGQVVERCRPFALRSAASGTFSKTAGRDCAKGMLQAGRMGTRACACILDGGTHWGGSNRRARGNSGRMQQLACRVCVVWVCVRASPLWVSSSCAWTLSIGLDIVGRAPDSPLPSAQGCCAPHRRENPRRGLGLSVQITPAGAVSSALLLLWHMQTARYCAHGGPFRAQCLFTHATASMGQCHAPQSSICAAARWPGLELISSSFLLLHHPSSHCQLHDGYHPPPPHLSPPGLLWHAQLQG